MIIHKITLDSFINFEASVISLINKLLVSIFTFSVLFKFKDYKRKKRLETAIITVSNHYFLYGKGKYC